MAPQTPIRVLILHDDPGVAEELKNALNTAFDRLRVEHLPEPGVPSAAALRGVRLVITDSVVGSRDCVTIASEVRRSRIGCPVVVYASTGGERLIVAALRARLTDWIPRAEGAEAVVEAVGLALHLDSEMAASSVPAAGAGTEVAAGYDDEYRIVAPDGSVRWIRDRAVPVRDETGRVTLAELSEDITDAKLSGQQLGLYRETFANASVAIAIIGPDGAYLEQNAAHAALLGYADTELEAMTPAIHLGAEQYARLAARLAADGQFRGEAHSRTRGGLSLDLELSAFAVRDSSGEPLCFVVTLRDVGERKRFQVRLADTEASFTTVFGAAPIGIVMADPDRKLVRTNAAFQAMVGYSHAELSEMSIANVTYPEDVEDSAELFRQLSSGEVGDTTAIQKRYRHKAGHVVWGNTTVTLFRDPDGRPRGSTAMIEDITEHKRTEQRLQDATRRLEESQAQMAQHERLASLGQVTAGVAHEINNPIAFVNINLGTLQEYVSTLRRLLGLYERLVRCPSAERQEVLGAIEALWDAEDVPLILGDVDQLIVESREGMSRVKEIARELTGFARVVAEEPREYCVNDGITAALKMVGRQLRYRADVITHLGTVPPIRCIPGQLHQLLMNLLVNASQSLDDWGRITIETRAAGDQIEIQISDDGVGIPPEHLDKLFTPFFTTKPAGTGTGLGLSITHRIVTRHGGQIDVDSTVGEGTTFSIRLPIAGPPST